MNRQKLTAGNKLKRVGLARALSKLGYCSRSQAAALIQGGRVRLNGAARRDPEAPVYLGRDRIEVDSGPVRARDKIYLMINKPRGIVTTAADEQGRETVYSLLDKSLPWVGPVGRLDKASEGLLLLTNDTEWSASISDPDWHIEKRYHVQIRDADGEARVRQLLQGVLSNGETLRVKGARILRSGARNAWLEIVLDEGKNRHIRRMFEHLGSEVLRLVRVAIGPLVLGQLAKGKWRHLTSAEKVLLENAISKSVPHQG